MVEGVFGSYSPEMAVAIEVLLLVGGLVFAFWVSGKFLLLIDKKIPDAEIKDGWVRYLIDGPKSVLVLGLVSVLLGILIINTDAAKDSVGIKLLGIVFTEFGFAFFIAFILHNTIEMHSRIERDRQVSKGIISYLYGVRLDEKMFNAAENFIFKSAFYRKNLRVEYEFVKILNDRIFLKHSSEYEVHNISERRQDFKIQVMIEKQALACGSPVSDAPRLGLHRISIDGVSLSTEEIERARSVDQSDDNFFQGSHLLSLDPGEKALIKTVSFLEKCERDSEFWRSLYPADGVEVRFTWRPEMNIEVMVDAIHPSGEFDRLPHLEDGLLEAKLSQPLFPYNGFLFWWSTRGARGEKGESPCKPAGHEVGEDGL